MFSRGYQSITLVMHIAERGQVQVSVSMGLRRGEQMSSRAESSRFPRSPSWSSTLNLQGELAWGEGGFFRLCQVWVWERMGLWYKSLRAADHFHELFFKDYFFL